MFFFKTYLKSIALITALLGVVACSSNPQFGAVLSEKLLGDTYTVEVRVTVSETLNPDTNERPSPLVLSIIQLDSESAFQSASVSELLNISESAPINGFIKKDSALLFPGKDQELDLEVSDDAEFIGVVAGFQIEDGDGKQLIPLKSALSRDLCIVVADTSLTKAERC